MKQNMPVTNNEVVMKAGTILVTRTDLKGIITFANDAFVELSGYSHDELVGSPHNIVRHPDMPSAVFEEMWNTLKKGNPWHRTIKNRTKSGDYYWVNANIMPVFENAQVVSYMSVRHVPSRTEIEEAEKLYRGVNANTAVLHSTGFKAFCKTLQEVSVPKKVAFASTLFIAPNAYLLYDAFNAANYGLVAAAASSSILGIAVLTSITSDMSNALEKAIDKLYQLSANKFKKPLNLRRDDQFGDLYRAIYAIGVKLGDDLAQVKQANAESLRIIRGLENVQSSVLIANANLDIIFANTSAKKLFLEAEADLQKALPNFKFSKLIGTNIGVFHKDPAYQRNLLANLQTSATIELELAGHIMQVIATPVITDNGERIGYVSEWLDRTLEAQVEHDIENLVNSVKSGDLSARIHLGDKEGFTKSLSININELTDVIESVFNDINRVIAQMANGDLTNTIHADYQGIYGQCKDNINDALTKISQLIVQLRETAEFVNTSSQEMASGNNDLSNRVERQASSLEQTASSMNALSTAVKNNAENTQQAQKVVQNATQLAEKGGDVVQSAITAMQEINESSNKIAEIIGVIDEIAFQTNLLALNASVEAARAGEQGRGFSVVATEVRNLAQRSANAAAQSSELIQNSVQKVRSGTAFVNETGAALMEIVDSIAKVGDIVGEITTSSHDQSAGIGQVNQNVSQMDEITQQNAALAEEAAASSMAMREQSAKMTQLLNFFNVGGKSSVRNRPVASSQPTAQAKAAFPSSSQSSPSYDEWEEF
ncbi:MAG: methyl-accepting chemotaxis protein [Methylococcales bacterium]|nr:methyl-accepting chemotaxis protein [Methylococcales bacterium]